ncbi:MAG: hypothetical protein PWQ55_475 [Chloroflexota bacterium]|nr:hypothetical protein [Chloroflexota bacterium]
MVLTTVEINDFRSIKNLIIPIEKGLMALVGANEHGKTNIIDALWLLNFNNKFNVDDIRKPEDPNEFDKLDCFITFTIDFPTSERRKIFVENIMSDSDGNSKNETIYLQKQSVRLKRKFSFNNIEQIIVLDQDISDTEENSQALGEKIIEFVRNEYSKKIFRFQTFDDRLEKRILKSIVVGKQNDIVNGLIKLAGLEGKESDLFNDSSLARQLLEKGGEKLTEELSKLWIQGKEDDINIKLNYSPDGNYLVVEIRDENTYGDVESRSRGFQFFISFILKFFNYFDGALAGYILLIEEPGIFLHPRGQKDLLRYLEKLGEKNQIIYSTHSPFMLNKFSTYRIRVVSKTKKEGTKIDLKPYRKNWKPVRDTLGIVLGDSFFYAEKNLLVEGVSDKLYITSLLLYAIKKEGLLINSDLLSLIDSGGSSNIPAMSQLVHSEDREFIILLDSDKAGNEAKKKLLHKDFINSGLIIEIGDFKAGAQTIEDVLPIEVFRDAVNDYIHELLANETITPKKEFKEYNITAKTKRINQLEKYLDENFEIKSISKLNIARHFEYNLETRMEEDKPISDIKESLDLLGELISKLELNQ